jgi:hypothetical protein
MPASKRVKGGKGYLMFDNRASGGKLIEMATQTCAHCGTIVVLNPERKRARGICKRCNAYICGDAACTVICSPIEKCVELAQKYPGLPTLTRGYNGELLFDPAFLDKGKIF